MTRNIKKLYLEVIGAFARWLWAKWQARLPRGRPRANCPLQYILAFVEVTTMDAWRRYLQFIGIPLVGLARFLSYWIIGVRSPKSYCLRTCGMSLKELNPSREIVQDLLTTSTFWFSVVLIESGLLVSLHHHGFFNVFNISLTSVKIEIGILKIF